jgi:hypothetical protein
MIKVRFVKSPTGRFGLAYSAGDVGYMPASLAEQAQKEGYIELLGNQDAIETADRPQQYRKVEKAVRRKK